MGIIDYCKFSTVILVLGALNLPPLKGDVSVPSLGESPNLKPERMLLAKKQLTDEEISQRKEWAEKELGFKESQQNFYRSIEQMQKFKTRSTRVYIRKNDRLRVSLENLNKFVNRWYIVKLKSSLGKRQVTYHIENPYPESQKLALSPGFKDGVVIKQLDKTQRCELWSKEVAAKLARLRAKPNKPYISMCDKSLYIRMKVEGYRTTKEWIVEFLRDNVWGGESITNFVKESIFRDKFIVTAETRGQIDGLQREVDQRLEPAKISDEFKNTLVDLGELGITLKNKRLKSVKYGQWYESDAQDDVFLSIIGPEVISEDIKTSGVKLDEVESTAINYLIAFDLNKYDLNYALGTEHPRLGWSKRVREEYRPNDYGPDGFDSDTPIVRTGLIPSEEAKDIVATFTAGFKRSHGAFKWGPLANINMGSHYGFAEKGVIFSTPQPGLATIVVYRNGEVLLKTWTEDDYKDYDKILHIRQNGVPLTEWDEEGERPVVGEFVEKWGEGNWSGSQDQKLRSLRAGVCQVLDKDKNFLIYGYFSSATPVAMAKVFESYGCHYSFHLDMNALEHTYLALYNADKKKSAKPQHLVKPMEVLDQRFKGNVPRFIGYPDNRDFFYLTPRK